MQAERTAPERKFVLTKVGPGDYLLPSNDGKTLWRLSTYEDGPSHGLDWPRDRTFWQVKRWDRPITADDSLAIDVEDWDRWETVEESLASRREAINAALGYLA